MGKTDEARQTVSQTHFLDVDAWAVPYVGYAYQQGITAGVAADRFGAQQNVTATEFLTFLLRCLGYENGRDFRWDDALRKTDWIGVTRGEYTNGQTFTRADAVVVCERALHAFCRNSRETLAEQVLGMALDEPLALPQTVADSSYAFRLADVPAYTGAPYVILNAGIPSFSEDELSAMSFYSRNREIGNVSIRKFCLFSYF